MIPLESLARKTFPVSRMTGGGPPRVPEQSAAGAGNQKSARHLPRGFREAVSSSCATTRSRCLANVDMAFGALILHIFGQRPLTHLICLDKLGIFGRHLQSEQDLPGQLAYHHADVGLLNIGGKFHSVSFVLR